MGERQGGLSKTWKKSKIQHWRTEADSPQEGGGNRRGWPRDLFQRSLPDLFLAAKQWAQQHLTQTRAELLCFPRLLPGASCGGKAPGPRECTRQTVRVLGSKATCASAVASGKALALPGLSRREPDSREYE